MSDPVIDEGRRCGPCSACCTVFGVPELEKRTCQACAHVGEGGCGIYPDRPASCRTFECQWLRGLLEVDGRIDTDLRPDACGVILDFQPGTPVGDVYTAWEVVPGAAARGPVREVIRGLKERFPVAVMRCDAE